MDGPGGKIHLKKAVAFTNDELSAFPRMETDFLFWPVSAGEKDKSARQCCVPAKRNLSRWSEPSDVKSIVIANEERSLWQIILGSNRLKNIIVGPRIQYANSGRITREDFGGEGINLVDGYFHYCRSSFVERLFLYLFSILNHNHV
jgi:hypothetical protein